MGGVAGLGRGSRVLTWVDGEMVLNSAVCLTDSWASVELPSYVGSLFSMLEMSLPTSGKCNSPDYIYLCMQLCMYVCILSFSAVRIHHSLFGDVKKLITDEFVKQK